MKSEITHIFLGDDLTFLSRKFISLIIATSALTHRFVIFTADKSWSDWNDFFASMGIASNRFLLLRTCNGKKGVWRGRRICDTIRLLMFSSPHILSHRRHYNLFLLLMVKLSGKNISFMSWGDIPNIEHGFRRIIQILKFKCYTFGLVQISSEETLFKNLYPKLNLITRPYMRDNSKVLALCENMVRPGRCLLIGNNCWYYHLYGDILGRLNWDHWDKVICMLNYGNDTQRDGINDFCNRMKVLYGDKLVLWETNLPFNEYLIRIQECSTYIFPGTTQGGIDLTYNMLLMGKRVVCKGVNYKWLKDIGCTVDNLDEFELNRCGLLPPLSENEVENNRRIVCEWTSMSQKNIDRWDRVYWRL